jgi:hypothetical protein
VVGQAAEQIIAGVVLSERLAVTMYGAIHRAQFSGQRNLRGLVVDPKMLAESSFRLALTDSGAVATAVAVLVDRMETRGPGAALRLGLGLWAAFPVVLLTGSVVHEQVPVPQAAIHAGGWLVKLLLVSTVVGRATAVRPDTVGRWRRIGRALHQRTAG